MARLATSDLVKKPTGESVPGLYAVRETCIDCDLCRQIAPLVFSRKFAGNTGTSYVERQPLTLKDEEACREALESCPVEAIEYRFD